jgi:hypothetical protein
LGKLPSIIELGAVTAMLSELSWETLEQRRAKTRAVLMYKIINNLVDIPSHTHYLYHPMEEPEELLYIE